MKYCRMAEQKESTSSNHSDYPLLLLGIHTCCKRKARPGSNLLRVSDSLCSLFQSIRPEREWQSTSFSSVSVVLGFPQFFPPAWAEDQFPVISHAQLNLYSDFSPPSPSHINIPFELIQDIGGSFLSTGLVPTHVSYCCLDITWF